MADIVLTPQQRVAATDRGAPLLVSAAAGSGKTKVLVERLFAYMEEEGCRVDDFLIITYTRAAAAELRGKIAAELNRRVAERPDDVHLRRQLFRVYQADIKTVDAFCVSLLRQNVHLLPPVEGRSLTPDFRALDEPEAALLLERVAQRTLERFYERLEAGDERCALLARTLGAGRDDRALEALMLQLHKKIQSHPYPERWLQELRRDWEAPPEELSASSWGRAVMEDAARRAVYWAGKLERETAELEAWPEIRDKYGPAFLETAGRLRTLAAAADEGWDAMGRAIPEFPRLAGVRGEDAKVRREQAKGVWDRCKAAVGKLAAPFRTTSAEHLEDLRAMAPAMLALVELTGDLDRAYKTEKARRNCMDFSDQEHLAIRILEEEDGAPTELAARISGRYREVMVDEYQDSNQVQERIFRAVSGGGEKLFVVGDVKQSIYRFRLADPRLFLQKYDAFPLYDRAQPGQARKVLLQQNFRSRPQVLEAVNYVFGGVLSRQMGEMEYGEEEKLYFGADYYLPRADADTELHLVSIEDEDTDRTEAESRFLARMVRRMLDEGFPVQEGDGFRPVRPEDIVVLMRSPAARIKALTAAMAREGVPFAGGEQEDFFASMEIAVILSFLHLIDNPRQDVPLIAVLRSPLVGFTPDDLARVRSLRPEGDYYDALCLDENETAVDFLRRLEELRRSARDLPADRLLWKLYGDFHALAVFGAMEGGEQRRNNLIALASHAAEQAARGGGALFDFITELQRLLERGEAPAISTRRQAGGVQLMTIHKSKGLEFPVVILADLQKDFNRVDLTAPVLTHPELGLGTDCVDLKRHIRYGTVAKTAVSMRMERENKAEEMRVLYVAMTRAREKLILVDCMKKARSHLEKLADMATYPAEPEAAASAGCLGDWVLLPLLCAEEGEPLRRWLGRSFPGTYVPAPGWRVQVWEDPCFDAAGNTAAERAQREEENFDAALLEGQYAHLRATRIPSKLTATQLKGREKDEEIAQGAPAPRRAPAFDAPRFLQRERKLTPAQRGTAMHLALQYLDLTLSEEEQVARQVEELCRRHLMTPEQAEAVDCAALARFLRSPLGRRIAGAEKVYREYRFALLAPAALYDAEAEGEELLLQGVVDCAFETPEGLAVVDFKTDRIAPGGEAERAELYRGQIEAYSLALTQVLERPVAERWLVFLATGTAFSL